MKIGEHKIESAEEFVRLSWSEDGAESLRSVYGWAEDAVWHDVLNRFPDMTSWVIHNKSVPHTILDRVIETGDSGLREEVTIKRKLNAAQMERLVRDPDWRVRQGIAGHPKISEELLLRLQKDSNHWVRRRAYQKLTKRKLKIGV